MSEEIQEAVVSDEPIVTEDTGVEGSGVSTVDSELTETSSEETTDVEDVATEADLKDAVEEAIEDGASDEEIKSMIREYEVKVNGKIKKVKVDLDNEEDLKRRIQLAEAGRMSMQELAELRKEVNHVLLGAKEDPWAFLENELGLDTEKLLEQRLEHVIEEKKKSPEQLEREKLMAELEQERAAKKKLSEEKEENEYRSKMEKYENDLNVEIVEALKQDPELPKTKKTVRRIADALLKAINHGLEDVSVADVLPYVKKDIKNEMIEFMSAMPEEMMETYLGTKNIERMRKRRLAMSNKKKAKTVEEIKEVTPEREATTTKKTKVKAKDLFRDTSLLLGD